jgi:hypothetical protein
MKGKTVFVLPNEQEIVVSGVINITKGVEVYIDHGDFGPDPLKCVELIHHFPKEGATHRYQLKVFLQ